MDWYYVQDGKQAGPVQDGELAALVQGGRVTPDTLVWHAGMQDWQPYGTAMAGATPAAPADSAPAAEGGTACSQCGRLFAESQLIAYEQYRICPACKPTFFQQLQEGGAPVGFMEFAGFWIRVGAELIDNIILGVANFVLSLLAGVMSAGIAAQGGRGAVTGTLAVQGVTALLQIGIALFYATWFVGRFAATPGKMLCGLRVVNADGSPVGYGKACGRYFAKMLSSLILGIGYLMVAFDDEKRGLHDRICGTRVIKK